MVEEGGSIANKVKLHYYLLPHLGISILNLLKALQIVSEMFEDWRQCIR